MADGVLDTYRKAAEEESRRKQLQSLGPFKIFGVSPGVPQEVSVNNDAQIREQQAKDPIWKQYGRNIIDSVVGAVKGTVGVDPAEDESNAGYVSNALIQLLTSTPEGAAKAGLPIMALTKGRPIFHGTPKVFDRFDPRTYDKSDTLGWMTHAAAPDIPDYAEGYAQGHYKSHYDLSEDARRPNIIALEPQNKNTLDLVDPNPDDMSQALAALDSYDRQRMISEYKFARKQIQAGVNPRDVLMDEAHYPRERLNKIDPKEIPLRYLAERLRMGPSDINRSPFDAIRYHDIGKESYAINPGTPIRSYYGKAPMTNDPTPIQVFRENSDRPYTGEAALAPDRWKHQPMSLRDLPNPEFEKLADTDFVAGESFYNAIQKIAGGKEVPNKNLSDKINQPSKKSQEFSHSLDTINEKVKQLTGQASVYSKEAAYDHLAELVDLYGDISIIDDIHDDQSLNKAILKKMKDVKEGKLKFSKSHNTEIHPHWGAIDWKKASKLVQEGKISSHWYNMHFGE